MVAVRASRGELRNCELNVNGCGELDCRNVRGNNEKALVLGRARARESFG